jgi:predicted TIM-barrel fold metal-dependent hydrolase
MDTAGSIAVHGIGFDAEPAARLYDELSRLTVIDAHEHLMPEHERIRRAPDAVSLFEAYPRMVLQASGMPADDLAAMSERSAPVEERWARLAPHLPHVRELALTRALMIGIRELYGIERIDDDTYLQATETLRAANRAGLYERTFRGRMKVAAALNQQYDSADPPWTMPAPGSFRITQMWESQLNFACKPEPLALIERSTGAPVRTLDAYVAGLEQAIAEARAQGVLGIKLLKEAPRAEPPAAEAARLFDRLLAAGPNRAPEATPTREGPYGALRDYLAHAIIRAAGAAGMTILFHCGSMGAGRDYRPTHPDRMVPVVLRYPHVRFELYHSGMPRLREAGMMAFSYPNVWLNMCWSQSFMPRAARSALAEWLDFVPVNKIIAFGGDSGYWIEHSVGDLVMTRANLAAVLGERVAGGAATQERAVDIGRMLLAGNAAALYDLGDPALGDYEYT